MLAVLLLSLTPIQDLGSSQAEPTWSGGVGQLIFDNCSECHRPGQAAPFSLLSYGDARRRAPMLAEVTREGFMPPWQPVEGHGAFRGERRLTADEISMLARWARAGAPEGDAQAAPEPPEFTGEWVLGPPDLVVSMVEGFDVPADGPDIYHNFVVPLDLDREVWVTAIVVRPGAPRVLHHVLFSIDAAHSGRRLDAADARVGFGGVDEGSLTRSRGLRDGVARTALDGIGLGGWAVGSQPYRLPLGVARRIPSGADLILRSHFHPSGKPETEVTTLGLYFADKPPTRSLHALQLPPKFGGEEGLSLDPGETGVSLQDSLTLPVDTLALSVGGHAHFLAETMHLWVTPPGGERRSLFRIDEWDFDWQQRYVYVEPVLLPAGTRVSARVTYDNSAENPDNPFNPPRPVRWGLQSTDEMGSVTVALVAADEDRASELAKALARHAHRRGPGLTLRVERDRKVFERYAAGAERLPISELPEELRARALFSDLNGDGALDRQELGLVDDGAPGYVPPSSPVSHAELAFGARKLEVQAVDGARLRPFDVSQGELAVLIFVTEGCPVAEAYAPEIAALTEAFSARGVAVHSVWVGELDTQPTAGLLDPGLHLARAAGATRTPEAVVIDASGALLYRGRIDDRFTGLGSRRQQPSQFDLRASIESVLAGEAIATPRTAVVGCLLPMPD